MANSGNFPGWFFSLSSGPMYLQLQSNSNAAHYVLVHTVTTTANGLWHTAVVTYSGSGTAAGVSMWIDGVLQTLVVDGDTLGTDSMVYAGGQLQLGSRDSGGVPFTGNIAYAALWTRQLQPFEATDLTAYPYMLEGATVYTPTNTYTSVWGGFTGGSALKSDGTCWTWGYNNNGQLGNQTGTNVSAPISVIGNHSFISITGGNYANFGLKQDGSVWGWGIGTSGQFGNLTTNSYSSPVAVIGNHSFVQLSYISTAYGLKSDGTAWAWGWGGSGALGNLTAGTNVSSPVSVAGNHSFIKIVSGANSFGMGLKVNGTLWCWGLGTSGQIGNLTTTNVSSPVSVAGNHSFVSMTATDATSYQTNMGQLANLYGGVWMCLGSITVRNRSLWVVFGCA